MDGRGILRESRRDRTGHRRHPAEGRHRGPHRVERRRVTSRRMEFTEQQIERYSRHIILPDVGGKGQKKLAAARVLVIGAGGLGSPASLYLAAAGVGTIGLVDGDVVDLSNLQRQILHTTANVGKPKVESGRKMLAAINPDVAIKTYQINITAENALSILSDYDLVLDGSDTFTTRYLVNDACFFAKKPLISGSIFRLDRKSTRLNSSHLVISYAVFCLKK